MTYLQGSQFLEAIKYRLYLVHLKNLNIDTHSIEVLWSFFINLHTILEV